MDKELSVGDVVISLTGHDKNKPFIIISIDKKGYPVIIDGRYRIKTNPKVKNPKHLQFVAKDEALLSKVMSPLVTNAEIYKMIKAYKIKE